MSEILQMDCGSKQMPDWVPAAARMYLEHTEMGLSMRRLAQRSGCHASTVMRQIRKLENRRDDRLVDEALKRLRGHYFDPGKIGFPTQDRRKAADQQAARSQQKETQMNVPNPSLSSLPDEANLNREALRILPRLSETTAVLAVAAEMEKAVVVREDRTGNSTRTAVVDRGIAEAMALKNWIDCAAPGRVSRYHITAEGRAALARLLAGSETAARTGFAEAQAQFVLGPADPVPGSGQGRRLRYNAAESPLTLLARRRDRNGKPFLSADLVAAGERLREDFELSRLSAPEAQNWDRFLTGADLGDGRSSEDGDSSGGARDRVAGALRDLGPGLGDVVLRCCCYLEGLEAAEKRMGWSARSGKIVLRIALQRLKMHYDKLGEAGAMIG